MAQKSKTINGFDLVDYTDPNGVPGVQLVKRDADGNAHRTGIATVQHGGNGSRIFVAAADAGAIGTDGVEVGPDGRPLIVQS